MKFSELGNEELLTQFGNKVFNSPVPKEEEQDLIEIQQEVLRRMSVGSAVATPPTSKPTYEELVKGLKDALYHLDYCGWGDAWERECSEDLRKELPALLERAQQ